MKITTVGELFTIGRKISYTGDMANCSGQGAIVSLEPASQWGGPYVRIILDDGRDMLHNDVTHMRPASERNGCMHRLLVEDGYIDEDGIATLFATAAMLKATKSAQKQEADVVYAADVMRLVAEYPQLEQCQLSKFSASRVAAKNIRKLLKAAFPSVKFSVTCDQNSINIDWTDGPTSGAVEKIGDQFSAGSFDGMDDCYKYSHSAWSNTFGSARYIFCHRDHSAEFVTSTIAGLAEHHDGELPTADDFKHGRLYCVYPSRHCDDWQSLIYRAMRAKVAP